MAHEFEPVEGMPGWSRLIGSETIEDLAELARKLNQTRPKNTYFVSILFEREEDLEIEQIDPHHFIRHHKTGPQIFRIETRDPLDIARAANVGSHDFTETAENVCEMLQTIHAQNPIVPFQADTASFSCEFEKPISAVFARFLNQNVTTGFEIYAEEDDCDIGAAVQRDGILQLWWD
jgi:hypothetical protein